MPSPTMQPPPLTHFSDAVRDSQVLHPEELQELQGLVYRCREPRELGRALLERGWLTRFQVNEIYRGRDAALTVRPYVLLERLGQALMATLCKARHAPMRRVPGIDVVHAADL